MVLTTLELGWAAPGLTGTQGGGSNLKIIGQYVSGSFACNPAKSNCKTSKYIPGQAGQVTEVALTR